MDEMSQAEIDGFKFKVCNMHFEDFNDALDYARGNIDATCIRHQVHGKWVVLWQDGDIKHRRPGFGVHVPYLGQKGLGNT